MLFEVLIVPIMYQRIILGYSTTVQVEGTCSAAAGYISNSV